MASKQSRIPSSDTEADELLKEGIEVWIPSAGDVTSAITTVVQSNLDVPGGEVEAGRGLECNPDLM